MTNSKVKIAFIWVFMFIISFVCSVFLFKGIALAGGGVGGGGGGPSGGPSDRIHWRWEEAPGGARKVFTKRGGTYGGSHPTLESYTKNQLTDSGDRGATVIAYVCSNLGPGDNGEDGFVESTEGACYWTALGNWGNTGNDIPGYIYQKVNQVKPIAEQGDIVYGNDTLYGNGWTTLSVFYDYYEAWVEKNEEQADGTITKVWDDRGTTFLDNTSKKMHSQPDYHPGSDDHAEFVFFDETNKVKYYGKTNPDEIDIMKTNIHYQAEEASELHTWEEMTIYDSDGKPIGKEKRNEKWSYKLTSKKTAKKTIQWNLSGTNIKQIKYRPYSLNRGGLATTEDIKDSFGDAKENLAAVTETIPVKQTNNEPIDTLDINGDTLFKFEFQNKKFGLPESLDWAEEPKPLANGTYENVTGIKYCNGKYSKNDLDGIHRYNTTFYASTTSLSKVANTSSLLIGDKETRSNDDPFVWVYDKNNEFTGSEGWSFRSNLFGDYTTDHTKDTTGKYKSWWLIEYDVNRYWEYGVEWEGYVKRKAGIQAPTWKQGTTNPSNGFKCTTYADHEHKDRGIYIGSTTDHYVQPVLYAKWKVKTLAGDVIGL